MVDEMVEEMVNHETENDHKMVDGERRSDHKMVDERKRQTTLSKNKKNKRRKKREKRDGRWRKKYDSTVSSPHQPSPSHSSLNHQPSSRKNPKK